MAAVVSLRHDLQTRIVLHSGDSVSGFSPRLWRFFRAIFRLDMSLDTSLRKHSVVHKRIASVLFLHSLRQRCLRKNIPRSMSLSMPTEAQLLPVPISFDLTTTRTCWKRPASLWNEEVNKTMPIWTCNPDDISQEEYGDCELDPRTVTASLGQALFRQGQLEFKAWKQNWRCVNRHRCSTSACLRNNGNRPEIRPWYSCFPGDVYLLPMNTTNSCFCRTSFLHRFQDLICPWHQLSHWINEVGSGYDLKIWSVLDINYRMESMKLVAVMIWRFDLSLTLIIAWNQM